MKKKFIDFDVFKQIENASVTTAERELSEAAEILAKALNETRLDLYCLSENDVTYINTDGNFVHANYQMNDKELFLENVEELVIDENSLSESRKDIISKLVDNILEDKLAEANSNFTSYFSIPTLRTNLREGIISEAKKHGKGKGKKSKMPPQLLAHFKAKMEGKKGKAHADKDEERHNKKKRNHANRLSKVGEKAGEHKQNEWNVVANNILEFVDFKNNGNIFNNVRAHRDSTGNVVGLQIPRTQVRNEGKVLMMTWSGCNSAVEKGRKSGMSVGMTESNWVRACSDMRKLNALSENTALQTTFENVVSAWPDLLYLTKTELSKKINETLEASGVSNYDDETCDFLADGLLRTAHKAFSDKVSKIYNVAGKTPASDEYAAFETVAESVFSAIDNNRRTQFQVFSDLYRSLSEVYRTADRMGDEATKAETASLLHECELVINRQVEPSLELAEDAALYLQTICEAVDLYGSVWDVPSVHVDMSGDNPAIHKYAAVDGSPAKNAGLYKSSPVSDGKAVHSNVEDHYTKMSGKDLYPDMSNPYAPKPGDFKMKGEKSVGDDSDDLGTYQGGDTWPNLKNPYLPDHGMTMQDTLQHLHGKG
jgi:hypothetical protein